MSENVPGNQGPTPGGAAAAPPAPSAAPPAAPATGVDAAAYERQLAELRAENERFRQGLTALQPYRETIERIASDSEYADFVRDTSRSYDEIRKQRGGQVPDELRPLEQKLDRLDKFVDQLEAQQRRASEEPRQRWLSEGRTFCEGLMGKHPNELGRGVDPTFAWAGALENLCASRGLSWEDGWKILEPAFVKQKSSPPPSSLRSDAGMPGLPPPSREPQAGGGSAAGKQLGQIVLERMRNSA